MPRKSRVRKIESPLGLPDLLVETIPGSRKKKKGEDVIKREVVKVRDQERNNDELVIHLQYTQRNNVHEDTLEIGGVLGTIDQWRKVLLPLLGLQAPEVGTLI